MKTMLRLVSLAAMLALTVTAFGVGSAAAQPEGSTRQYIVGTGLLCDLDPAACPAISANGDGDTITITGGGTFDVDTRDAQGGGTFVHRDAAGNTLGAGTWVAERLLSFDSYGDATPQDLPEEFEGGLARIRVHLFPATGERGFDAVLQIDCLLGEPPAESVEGFELEIDDVPTFDQEVQGFTLFIRQQR